MSEAKQKELHELSSVISKKNNDDIALMTEYTTKTSRRFRRAAYIM